MNHWIAIWLNRLIAQRILDVTDIVMFKAVGPILFICKCGTKIFCAPSKLKKKGSYGLAIL